MTRLCTLIAAAAVATLGVATAEASVPPSAAPAATLAMVPGHGCGATQDAKKGSSEAKPSCEKVAMRYLR